eukprot:NP_497454.1 Uncharacterized protein CELE_Y46E12A.2 [Caenorhabditis elegans]
MLILNCKSLFSRHVCFEMKIPVRAVGRWTEYSPTVGSHWIELRTIMYYIASAHSQQGRSQEVPIRWIEEHPRTSRDAEMTSRLQSSRLSGPMEEKKRRSFGNIARNRSVRKLRSLFVAVLTFLPTSDTIEKSPCAIAERTHAVQYEEHTIRGTIGPSTILLGY